MGKCIMDRTAVLEDVEGRPNQFMLSYLEGLRDLKKHIVSYLLRDIKDDIQKTQESNDKLVERMMRIEELMMKSTKQIKAHKEFLEVGEKETQKRSEIAEELNIQRAIKQERLRTLENVKEKIR
jgi:hypothetical protein